VKAKKVIGLLALAVILVAGCMVMRSTFDNVPITYDGSDVNVVDLINDPATYDTSDPDGVADIIVKTGLDQTRAVNNVAAIVFDYRGFDTIGESFILLAAISGCYVILRSNKNTRKEEVIDEIKE